MGNSASRDGFVKSSSYSTLNLNRKLNIYTNNNGDVISADLSNDNTNSNNCKSGKSKRSKSASTSSLSSLSSKSLNFNNINSRNFRWLFIGKFQIRNQYPLNFLIYSRN